MEELEKVPIYRVNDYGKGMEFLENYLKTKNIDTDTLNIEFYVKNELLYFVPFPLFPTNKTNERKYVLFVAHKDEYKPFLDDIVFSEDILKKLVNSQILSQTNEYGHFNAYKVVDKENFIHQYVNKINATKIKKDTDIYLLKLHASDYSIVLKQYKYERLPFETLKLSDIEKLLEDGTIKKVYYNYDLGSKTIDIENDKDIIIRVTFDENVGNINNNLWEARRFLEKNKSISAYGHSKEEALAKLKQKYQNYINSKKQEKTSEKLNVMAHKKDSCQITKKIYRHCIIDSNKTEMQDEELEIEEKLLQNPMTLSGGQQQRVAIARAIYTHPTILLGDELTGNLDSTTSISVMKFLKKMCKKYRQTMIIVTHDERIAAMADRIIQMKDGRVV